MVDIETIHHDYRPTFVHLQTNSLFNNDVAFDTLRAIFTKLCTSKNQYVGGKHMTLH